MASPDVRSDASRVDTSEFFFAGAGLSALLIHGLSGTPYEMRYLGERLAAAGVRVRGVRLAGHAASPEDLAASNSQAWYASVIEGFEELRGFGDPIVVIGLSAGAVLGARLAAERGDEVAGLAMLSPAFFLPRAASSALRFVRMLGAIANRLYIGSDASDIHDAAARSVHPSLRIVPLGAAIELLALSASVRPLLARITQPTLLIHSRRDHTCPMERNLRFVTAHLGSTTKRSVILEESFHVITVDSDKERVADEVLAFAQQFRASASSEPGTLHAVTVRG
jgi:carboxylesterase